MAKKTRTQLEKELAATRREETQVQDQLNECRRRNSTLSADLERRTKGLAIHLHEQVRRGSYADLAAIVKRLVDDGLWFFDLKKD